MLTELGGRLDLARVHFTGQIPHPRLLDLFRIAGAHVYLTYPFVLSWSLLEAMACAALVVGSATAPVQEAIRHGENGLLVDFFDSAALAATVAEALAAGAALRSLRAAARASVVARFDLRRVCLPAQLALAAAVAAGRAPAP